MRSIPPDPFILVDGSSYLFRAYHALPPLTTSSGQPTGAIYGVINMLRKIISQYHPSKMAVVFDSKEKNFRHALYTPYKANRVVMPEDLQRQIEPLYAIIRGMGLPLIMIPGIEADDIIGSLAIQAKKQGLFTLISTGDKDFTQLVDNDIFLMNTMTDELFDRNKVIEKFEVPPEKMIDYLALIGDTVDNVPGVPKVGRKTAVKWLETYGDLKTIIAHADQIPGKVGENLRATLEQLPLFQTLVTIKIDVSVGDLVNDLKPKDPDRAALENLFGQLEFKNWLKMLGDHKPTSPEIQDVSQPLKSNDNNTQKQEYETITTGSHFEKWIKRLEKAALFALDTETTSLEYMSAEIVGVSFAIGAGEAAYIPLQHDYEGAPPQLSREMVLGRLKPLLEDKNRLKVGQNLKFDLEVLANHGIRLQGIAFDTMLESYILGSTLNRHDLDTLAKKYLHYDTVRFEDIAGKGAKQITFNQVPIEKASFYAAEDADVTLKLHQVLWPKLQDLPKQKTVFETIEIPLIPVLASMERCGVLIDPVALSKQSALLETRLAECETQIYTLAGHEFNINSPKQLQEVLFNELKLPILEKTPLGQPSTAESVLQELSEEYPLPSIILEYRSLGKLKSTYIDKLPEQINPQTGRVHTSYHQAVTATGRLSSTDPNLQNIPVRTVEGRKIRSAFIAPPGYKIVSADYSQIELRIMAHLSQDPMLLKAFTLGDDIHKNTASTVFGVPLDKVTTEQRRHAKAINFGLMYGMSAFGLGKQLGINNEAAQAYMTQYFACFPKVKQFMESMRQSAAKQGYVETLFGRRLYLPDLQSPRMALRRAAERAAINAPMQGTNADLIKLSMIEIHNTLLTNPNIRMIMQVHDELVFEIAEDLVGSATKQIKSIMENRVSLSVALHVGIGVGNNWDEAH